MKTSNQQKRFTLAPSAAADVHKPPQRSLLKSLQVRPSIANPERESKYSSNGNHSVPNGYANHNSDGFRDHGEDAFSGTGMGNNFNPYEPEVDMPTGSDIGAVGGLATSNSVSHVTEDDVDRQDGASAVLSDMGFKFTMKVRILNDGKRVSSRSSRQEQHQQQQQQKQQQLETTRTTDDQQAHQAHQVKQAQATALPVQLRFDMHEYHAATASIANGINNNNSNNGHDHSGIQHKHSVNEMYQPENEILGEFTAMLKGDNGEDDINEDGSDMAVDKRKKNKNGNKDKRSTFSSAAARRRSSFSMRGKRVSRFYSDAIPEPHSDIQSNELYRHINGEISEPARMKQMLLWCINKPSKSVSSTLITGNSGAEHIQNAASELLHIIASKTTEAVNDNAINTSWYQRQIIDSSQPVENESSISTDSVQLNPNPRNEGNKRKKAELMATIQRLRNEESQWKDQIMKRSMDHASNADKIAADINEINNRMNIEMDDENVTLNDYLADLDVDVDSIKPIQTHSNTLLGGADILDILQQTDHLVQSTANADAVLANELPYRLNVMQTSMDQLLSLISNLNINVKETESKVNNMVNTTQPLASDDMMRRVDSQNDPILKLRTLSNLISSTF